MDEKQREFWERIQAFDIDGGPSEFSFADRVARENAWSQAFTRRVIDEYKKFIFLAINSGHRVTPSDQVDKVWHLHLTYTRSYWDRLCRDCLSAPLHHHPTGGGPEERQRFRAQYEQTLGSYQHFFGEFPPSDIWPDVSIRFREARISDRIKTSVKWLVISALSMSLLLVAACGLPPLAQDSSHGKWLTGIGIVLAILAGAFLLSWIFDRCPSCAKPWSMEPSGKKRSNGSGLFKVTEVEYECKYCGYTMWKDKDADDVGCD